MAPYRMETFEGSAIREFGISYTKLRDQEQQK